MKTRYTATNGEGNQWPLKATNDVDAIVEAYEDMMWGFDTMTESDFAYLSSTDALNCTIDRWEDSEDEDADPEASAFLRFDFEYESRHDKDVHYDEPALRNTHVSMFDDSEFDLSSEGKFNDALRKALETQGTMKLTDEQAKKAANMMLQSAEYCKTLAGPTVFIPSIHSAKEDREENLKAITKEIAALVSVYGFDIEQGKLFDLLFNHLLADAHFNVPENVWKSLAAEYQTAPIYTDRKGNEVTLYDGLWHDGHMGKLNLIYIDEYQFTGRHADVERMERQIERRRNKKIMNA